MTQWFLEYLPVNFVYCLNNWYTSCFSSKYKNHWLGLHKNGCEWFAVIHPEFLFPSSWWMTLMEIKWETSVRDKRERRAWGERSYLVCSPSSGQCVQVREWGRLHSFPCRSWLLPRYPFLTVQWECFPPENSSNIRLIHKTTCYDWVSHLTVGTW